MSVKSTEVDAKGVEGLLGVVDNVDPVAIYNQGGLCGAGIEGAARRSDVQRDVNVDTDPASGKVRFIPTDPRYGELLQFVNKLYKDGWSRDIMSVKSTEVDAKGVEGLLGVVDNVDPVAIYNQEGYVGPVLKAARRSDVQRDGLRWGTSGCLS